MKVGPMSARIEPSIALEWTFRCMTTLRPEWRSARSAAWLPCEAPPTRNQVRAAPHASAASSWACSNGIGIGRPDVDALDQRGEVHVERLLSERVDHRRVGADAALVPGNGQPGRVARGVLAQGVDVGNPVLVHASQSLPRDPSRPEP